jgi:hypothetical protein
LTAIEPPVTEILQGISKRHGRVGAPFPLSFGLRSRVLLPTDLPFYKKHPKLTGAALGITGTILLAPVAVFGALAAVGFTSAGIAAGILILFPPKEIRY